MIPSGNYSEESPYVWTNQLPLGPLEEQKALLDAKDPNRNKKKQKELKTLDTHGDLARAAFKEKVENPTTQNAGLFGLLGYMVRKEELADNYSIKDFEPMIYNNKHHSKSLSRWLIMTDGIFSVDGEQDSNQNTDTGVLRCFRDWRVFLADVTMLLIVLLSCLVSPCTFMWGGTWADHRVPESFLVADLLLDFCYGAYLILLLNTSFMHSTRRVEVVRRDKIIARYIWSPIYWIMWFSTTTYLWIGAARGPLLLNLIKYVRTVHLCWLPDSMWQMRDTRFARIVRPILLLVLTSHWVACMMMPLAGWREQKDKLGIGSFATSFDGKKVVSDYMSAYLSAFVEAIYMLTGALDNPLGDDSTRHRNFGSLIIVALFGPVGVIIVAMLISVVVQEQTLTYALDIRHVENKAFISRALENLNIPQDLQARVFSLHYFQKMSHDHEAFGELFKKKNLSAPLECALRIYLYHDSFLHSGYFKEKDTNYILEVVRCLEDRVFLPGDYVTRRGEVGGQMFFIARGVLTVKIPLHRPAQDEVAPTIRNSLRGPGSPPALKPFSKDIYRGFSVAQISKGDYFGEIALIADCLRTAWVVADCYVILSELKRHAIERIWKYFPSERQILIDAITAKTSGSSKDAMHKIWRTAAKKGVKMAAAAADAEAGKAADGENDDELQGDESTVPELRSKQAKDITTSTVMTAAPTGTSVRSQNEVEELEAKYHFALEAVDLLENINPPLAEVAKAGQIGDLAKRFESFCTSMQMGQEKLQERMSTLTNRVEDLAQSQGALKNSIISVSTAVSQLSGEEMPPLDKFPTQEKTKRAKRGVSRKDTKD